MCFIVWRGVLLWNNKLKERRVEAFVEGQLLWVNQESISDKFQQSSEVKGSVDGR